mgnify:CR=1 FL=1
MSAPEVLSPAAKQAVETKRLEGAWSGRGLLKLMAEVEYWDLKVEERRKSAEKWWIISIIAAVIGFILMIVVTASTGLFPVGLVLFAVPFVSIFVFKRKLNAMQAADLPDELRKSLRPVLKQLGQDLHPEEKIKGTINLAGIDPKRCKLKKSLAPGKNRSLDLSVYEEELCDLRLPLADGSMAGLHVHRLRLDINRLRNINRDRAIPRPVIARSVVSGPVVSRTVHGPVANPDSDPATSE